MSKKRNYRQRPVKKEVSYDQAFVSGLLRSVVNLGGGVLREDFDFNEQQIAQWQSRTLISLSQFSQVLVEIERQGATEDEAQPKPN